MARQYPSTTKVNHVPYDGVYRSSQLYLGENLANDVKEVIGDYKPTMIITTHVSDGHPDHKIAGLIMVRIKVETFASWDLYESVVHFRGYPNRGDFLYPPRKLFNADWVSLELIGEERDKKWQSIAEHKSQYDKLQDRMLFDGLVARNEIFEKK